MEHKPVAKISKLKDLKVNSIVSMPLVVTKAYARETKAKKPYLQLELFDGNTKLPANYWDWRSGKVPELNTVLDVEGVITEYAGNMQINIKSLKNNTSKPLADFTPSGSEDVSKVYADAFSAISEIRDDFLRSLALEIFEQLQRFWVTVPGANTIHHAYAAGTLIHSLSVANIARGIARELKGANEELAFIGGMLHDVGKLFTYRMNGLVCEMTDEGMLLEHTFLGAQFVGNFAESNGIVKSSLDDAKIEILQHIILSHHGKREYGAAVTPMCIEAYIVHCADMLDASAEQIRVSSDKLGKTKFTERIWALDNRPHLTTQYVHGVYRDMPSDSCEEDEDDLPF